MQSTQDASENFRKSHRASLRQRDTKSKPRHYESPSLNRKIFTTTHGSKAALSSAPLRIRDSPCKQVNSHMSRSSSKRASTRFCRACIIKQASKQLSSTPAPNHQLLLFALALFLRGRQTIKKYRRAACLGTHTGNGSCLLSGSRSWRIGIVSGITAVDGHSGQSEGGVQVVACRVRLA